MDNNLVLGLLPDNLLNLHKLLVDYERNGYEKTHGKVTSGDFLNLLLGDPNFSWLRRFSELIVWIDEVMDPKELTAEEEIENIFTQARKLLTPAEFGEDFERKYTEALQQNPDVILAHKEVRDVLKLHPKKAG